MHDASSIHPKHRLPLLSGGRDFTRTNLELFTAVAQFLNISRERESLLNVFFRFGC